MLIILLNPLFSLHTFDLRVRLKNSSRGLQGEESVRYQNNDYSNIASLLQDTVLKAYLSCKFLLQFYSCMHKDPIKMS